MKREFVKRVSSPRQFYRDFSFVMARIPRYIEVARAKRVSLAFAEKIRLVITAVNQCVLCARVHSEWAQMAGVDQSEIRALLNNDLQGGAVTDDAELTALVFAQHFAESNPNPAPEMTRRLNECYGEGAATDIMLIIRLVNFFNLAGNTVEAFVGRFAGKRAPGSSLIFEAMVVLVGSPLVVPLFVYTTLKRNRFEFKAEKT